jgi:hypothetical protein
MLRRTVMVIACLLLQEQGASAYYLNGAGFSRFCTPEGLPSASNYVMGVVDMLEFARKVTLDTKSPPANNVCVPVGVGADTLVDLTCAYIRSDPSMSSAWGATAVTFALQSRYPCQR